MPKVKVSTGQTRDKFGRFAEKLDLLKEEHLGELSATAIAVSPVDTGTYITSHEINPTGTPSGSTTSKGKPTKQPYQPFADEGLNNLWGDIQALPEGFTSASLTNKAEHAQEVENEHGVYAVVRREANRIAQEIFNGL